MRQIRHLTPPPMGAGGVDYTLENDAGYQPQKQRTEALLAGYEERRPQRALEQQQYASEAAFIDCAVDNEKGWQEPKVPPMTMLTIHHEDGQAIRNSEFRFMPQDRKGTFSEDVKARTLENPRS